MDDTLTLGLVVAIVVGVLVVVGGLIFMMLTAH